MKLKKGFLFAVVCLMLTLPVVAETKGGHTTADITYQTAPIYKILDSSNYYVVLYGKYGSKIGTVTIPKNWGKWKKDTPRKLTVRDLPSKMQPFITVVQKEGNFNKVILTIPTDKKNKVWGMANRNLTASEPESIELDLR